MQIGSPPYRITDCTVLLLKWNWVVKHYWINIREKLVISEGNDSKSLKRWFNAFNISIQSVNWCNKYTEMNVHIYIQNTIPKAN